MTTPDSKPKAGWTHDTMLIHVLALMDEKDKAVATALAAADKAIVKVESETNRRDDIVRALELDVAALREKITAITGAKSGRTEGWGWAAAVVFLVVAVLAVASRFVQ